MTRKSDCARIRSLAKKGADPVMVKRAQDLVHEFQTFKDPKELIVLVAQFFQEASAWLDRYPAEETAIVWGPAFDMALMGLYQWQEWAKANPDQVAPERQQTFDDLMATIQEIQDEQKPGTIVTRELS